MSEILIETILGVLQAFVCCRLKICLHTILVDMQTEHTELLNVTGCYNLGQLLKT